ncbi:MAG: fibronectin type III domain-containing protein [Planctomycetia bacterium]|nr:fibronectin type III domain-containing protein [Planctomycetia bacterium]
MRKSFAIALAVVGLVALAGVAGADPLAAPGGLSPAGGEDVREPRPVLSWSAVPGAASYRAGWSVNGSLERFEAVNTTSLVLPDTLGENSLVTWRVRAVDAQGLAGEWSGLAEFWSGRDILPPEPAAGLTVLPEGTAVRVRWEASPSLDVAGYQLYHRPEGGTYANPDALGRVTTTLVAGLDPAVAHEFMVTAVDGAGNESAGVVAVWRPGARVTVNGKAFTTIQSAIDAAQPGDVVEVAAGTFLEGVSLPPGVSLRGAGPGLTVLDAAGFPAAVTLEAWSGEAGARTTVSNLALRGGAAGVWGGLADVRLENVVICRANGPGVKTDGGVLELARVTVAHCQGDGVDTGAEGTVVDALVFGNRGMGLNVRRAGAVAVGYSDLYDNLLGGWSGALAGPGLLGVAARFENEPQDDYRVLAGDATIDAGDPLSPFAAEPSPNGGRVNMGAFGNTPAATPSLAPAAGTAVSTQAGSAGSSSRGGKYCIVATASYGSEDVSRVDVLRAMRDRVLRPTPTGARAVATYENAAAPVAREIGKSEVLRALAREWIGR